MRSQTFFHKIICYAYIKDMNKEQLKGKVNKFFESKVFKYVIYGLATVFILSFVFQAGVMVGFRKASFSHNWGNNYERNFGPNRQIPRFIDEGRGMMNAHGAVGRIIKVESPNIIVLDKDQTEKIVKINEDTSILERKEKVDKNILAVDQFVIVIGNPNDTGQIEAKLIRIMPNPEEMPKLNMKEFNNNNI